MSTALLKEMFVKMIESKNISTLPHYYHKDFLMTTNGQELDYAKFYEIHEQSFATPIQYEVKYDEETLFERGTKVAGRLWITLSWPDKPAAEIEVVLVAEYKDDKLYRFWELTFPDWSQLPQFSS